MTETELKKKLKAVDDEIKHIDAYNAGVEAHNAAIDARRRPPKQTERDWLIQHAQNACDDACRRGVEP